MPRDFYHLTPREYSNLIKGREKQIDDEMQRAAVVAIMHRKAQHKKTLKMNDLVGKKKNAPSEPKKRSDSGEKQQVFEELELKLGKPQ